MPATVGVDPAQRFNRKSPCPICGGHKDIPQGRGQRCYGFLSEDRKHAYCSREEYAGPIPKHANSGTFAHKLQGGCHCGTPHDPHPAPVTNIKELKKGSKSRTEVEVYDYHDANGNVVHQTVRYEPKGFSQRRPDGAGGYVWSLKGVEPVLYRLPEVQEAIASGRTVFIVEGEKDADNARERLGVIATTCPMGAEKWRDSYTDTLAGAHTVFVEDNDEAGCKHVRRAVEQVARVAESVKVLELPGLPNKGDITDWIEAGGTKEKLRKLVRQARPYEGNDEKAEIGDRATPKKNVLLEGLISARELWSKEFPEPKWAVPGVIPEGVMILAGKPKLGKSWLAYHLAIAVAAGGVALGNHKVEQGRALYLALEDGERRLQKRLKKLIVEGEPPKGLELVTRWPRLDAGGADLLETWLQTRENPRLVVIDTLKKVRPHDAGRRNIYDVDYEALEPLMPLANDYGVAIVVVHHLRQMDADDPLDTISGSTGLTGGVDGAMVLKRERGRADAFLYVTHRDLEDDLEMAMGWDQLTATWVSKGSAEEYRLSQERAAVLKVLRDVPEGMSPKDIHEALAAEGHKTSQGALRRLLPKMVSDGQVKNPRYGVYTLGNTGNTGSTTDTYGEYSYITPGNSGNTTGNTSATVTGDFGHGNSLEPILEPTVTGGTAVTAESGHGSETDRIEATREAVADSNKLTLLRDQVVAGRADPDAFAGALAAKLGGGWKDWRDVARALADEYPEERRHG